MEYANYRAHAFGLGIKGSMAQQAAQKHSHLAMGNFQKSNAITRMTQRAFVEIVVASEESRGGLLVQQSDDRFVLHPLAT
jgi:hypothetical protein